MLNNKRNRDPDKSPIEVRRNPNSEDIKNIQQIIFGTEKVLCEFCKKDITMLVKIACVVCPKTIYCIDCLVTQNGKDKKTKHSHDYQVIDKLSMHLFSPEWSAKEELNLILGTLIENFIQHLFFIN